MDDVVDSAWVQNEGRCHCSRGAHVYVSCLSGTNSYVALKWSHIIQTGHSERSTSCVKEKSVKSQERTAKSIGYI
jgi:hypothetical protein